MPTGGSGSRLAARVDDKNPRDRQGGRNNAKISKNHLDFCIGHVAQENLLD
jgi:hypothetical protein